MTILRCPAVFNSVLRWSAVVCGVLRFSGRPIFPAPVLFCAPAPYVPFGISRWS